MPAMSKSGLAARQRLVHIDGGRAVCAVRLNGGGRFYTLVYDKIISREDRRRRHVAGLKG